MISLNDYVKYVFEGGAAGHMNHPSDMTDWTCQDFLDLIKDTFGGKIEDISEKIDGTQIQWTMSDSGEPRFIRNKGDLAREDGGMSLQDMIDKWKDKPEVQHAFVQAGQIIQDVCKNIQDKSFFHPDEETRRYVNCECVVAGKTNIMYYADDQVDFHNIWEYKLVNGKWEKSAVTKDGLSILDKACDKVDKAKLTPKLMWRLTDNAADKSKEFQNQILKLFKDEGLYKKDTLEQWKKVRFGKLAPEWMQGNDAFFNRWLNGDKSVNIRELKKAYPDHVAELMDFDKNGYKGVVKEIIKPIDLLFIKIGNAAISMVDGFLNGKNPGKAIAELKADLDQVVKDIQDKGSVEVQDLLKQQLDRMQGEKLNELEGIVFTYKGRMMKWTGSFAATNQILGSLKYKV